MKTFVLLFVFAVLSMVTYGQALEKLSQIPTPKQISTKQEAKWRNPVIRVRSEAGVSINGRPTLVPLESLLDALAALSASAWPYGRIVLLNEFQGLDGFRGDRHYLERLHAILKSANIKMYSPESA